MEMTDCADYEQTFYNLDKKRENEDLTDNEAIEYLKAQMEMCRNNKLTIEDRKRMVYDYFDIIQDKNKLYKKTKEDFDLIMICSAKLYFTHMWYQEGYTNRLLHQYADVFLDYHSVIEFIDRQIRNLTDEHKDKNDILFSTIRNLCHKCIFIAREIECLMKNGFPNGALARWRTLFEYNMISNFILGQKDNAPECAERYIYYADIERYKFAKAYKEHAPYFEFKKLSKKEFEEKQKIYDKLIKKYGEDFGKEYGWARKYLKNANFTEIVKQSKINQHMILQYKWSCGYVHGNANNLYTNLAYLQSQQNIYDDLTITDMSCYGFTEPLQLTCLCLIDILSDLYLCDRRKREDLVVLSVLMHYCKDIAKKCSKIEDEVKKDDKFVK